MDEVKLWLAGLIASFYRQALNFYNLSGLLHFNRIASIRVGDFWYQSNIFNLFLVVYSDQLKIAAIDYTSRAWECRIPALCGYWVFYFCLFYALYFTFSCFASMTFRLSLDSMVMRSHWHLPIRAAIEVQWTWLSSWRYGTMCVSWNIKGTTYICSFLFSCPKMQCTLIFDGGKIPSSMACRCLNQLSFLQFEIHSKGGLGSTIVNLSVPGETDQKLEESLLNSMPLYCFTGKYSIQRR